MGRRVRDEGDRIIEGRIKASSQYGLCYKCRYLKLVKTEFGKERAWCDEDWDGRFIRPNTLDPVQDCATYYPKGQLTLNEMMNMYWKIDRVQRQIGFGTTETYDVKIEKPKEEGGSSYDLF